MFVLLMHLSWLFWIHRKPNNLLEPAFPEVKIASRHKSHLHQSIQDVRPQDVSRMRYACHAQTLLHIQPTRVRAAVDLPADTTASVR